MTVREALVMINQVMDEILSAQDGDMDTDTRWAIAWFDQYGYKDGPYGEAEVLCTAKSIAVQGLVEAGIVKSGGGKVRLLGRDELDKKWNPETDTRLTAWEAVQHLIYSIEKHGEVSTAELYNKIGDIVLQARDLAYRMYQVCETKGWADDARGYNILVSSWPEVERLAYQQKADAENKSPQQASMF